MVEVCFLRHCEADYALEQIPGEFPGVPLTSRGKEQARELLENLRNFDQVYCSDMRRAKETLEQLLSLFPNPHYDPRLREIDDEFGEVPELQSFLDDLRTKHGRVLVVAHFNAIRYLTRKLGAECSLGYGQMKVIRF